MPAMRATDLRSAWHVREVAAQFSSPMAVLMMMLLLLLLLLLLLSRRFQCLDVWGPADIRRSTSWLTHYSLHKISGRANKIKLKVEIKSST
jgi:uncharacterized membrane protein